jgi:hypothetical protein
MSCCLARLCFYFLLFLDDGCGTPIAKGKYSSYEVEYE